MENAGYFFAAFAIIWVAVFGYVMSIYLRQKRLIREIDTMKEILGEKGINDQ